MTKPIEDRGIEINWFQKGGDYKENQLLTIIENKIHASEQMSGFPPSKDVWKEYFGEDINGEETRKYILNNSLYRPRDIIRMMSAIHNQIGTSEKFTQEAFDKAQQEYSELMWTEIKDELRLSYSEDEVNAMSIRVTKAWLNIHSPLHPNFPRGTIRNDLVADNASFYIIQFSTFPL